MSDGVNWNIYRYAGDYVHLSGMVFGLCTVFQSKSVEGFSKKTQILVLLVFLTRYVDVLLLPQPTYLLIFKLLYITITTCMLFAFYSFHTTYDATVDSCNIMAFLPPVSVTATVLSLGQNPSESLWTFSEMLEPFAIVPQYIVCYRTIKAHVTIQLYLIAVGGYRVFYVMHWIYKRIISEGQYHDYHGRSGQLSAFSSLISWFV